MKKTKLESKLFLGTKPTRYYKCVNCGYLGDFGKIRQTKLKCEDCGYDMLTDLDKVEFNERRVGNG
jgi:DNA-directed RNA polymerase subunit RPC12/RpoP